MTFQLDALANGWLSSFLWRDYRRLAGPAEKFLSHTTTRYYLLLLGMARRLVFRYTGTTGHRLVPIIHNDSKKCRLVFALSSLPTPWLWRVQRPKRANLPNTVYRYHGSGTLFPGPRSGNLLELFYQGDQKGAVSSQLSAP
jgi:hypothetical protein